VKSLKCIFQTPREILQTHRKLGSFKLGFQGSNVKIKAIIETRLGLGLKLVINIKLANPKSIFLHQEHTPIPGPKPNVGTNIIDYIYTKRYKKHLY
jgi:hypothetical protein